MFIFKGYQLAVTALLMNYRAEMHSWWTKDAWNTKKGACTILSIPQYFISSIPIFADFCIIQTSGNWDCYLLPLTDFKCNSMYCFIHFVAVIAVNLLLLTGSGDWALKNILLTKMILIIKHQKWYPNARHKA